LSSDCLVVHTQSGDFTGTAKKIVM